MVLIGRDKLLLVTLCIYINSPLCVCLVRFYGLKLCIDNGYSEHVIYTGGDR